ncbi:MAG: competence/damage-inducible protein A [Planctomycetes bacterium]|nr:competence/damage-inducible protein A [Planctomycetota bacterium]MCW8138869.1 competence/damage-inducible protein A [Planctomycetota bacterium]
MAIGNELLSGKVRDQNVHYLAQELRELGVPLRLVLVVPDEVPAIVDALALARARAEAVLTTGGVGPTHDDVTIPALAEAFGVDRVRDPQLERDIQAYYGGRANGDVLAMADLPRGAELLRPVSFFLPIIRLGPVLTFPGEPGALRRLFEGWKAAWRRDPFVVARLELDADEGELAPHLRAHQTEFPTIQIGSYPRFDEGAPYRVLVTLEDKDAEAVRRAGERLAARLRDGFGAPALLRVDFPPGATG